VPVTHQGIARYLVSSRSGVHRDGALGQEPLDPHLFPPRTNRQLRRCGQLVVTFRTPIPEVPIPWWISVRGTDQVEDESDGSAARYRPGGRQYLGAAPNHVVEKNAGGVRCIVSRTVTWQLRS
jgi:hypothetical protein